MKRSRDTSIYVKKMLNFLVFRRVAAELGGKLRLILVGGAPLAEETHTRIRDFFNCTVQVGYGCTETGACLSGTIPCDLRTGVCGGPCRGVLVRLEDWDEGGYRTTDKPYPRGEVLAAGPNVAKGYFLRPEETKKTFVEKDGKIWFRTGDIAEIDDTGAIRIIDRKGDFIKLNDGEIIALGRIEFNLQKHPLVENIFVHAKAGAERCVCIVVPNINQIMEIAQGLKLDANLSFGSICQQPQVVAKVLEMLQKFGHEQGL